MPSVAADPSAVQAALAAVEQRVTDIEPRTMIGLTPDRLSEIQLPVSYMRPGDTLYLAAWVPARARATITAADAGVRVVTVPPDPDQPFAAYMIIGSQSQLPPDLGKRPFDAYARQNHADLSAVIVTRGAEGTTSYTADGDIGHHPALEASVVDATGAGDAFAAGVLVGCHETRTLPGAIRWATPGEPQPSPSMAPYHHPERRPTTTRRATHNHTARDHEVRSDPADLDRASTQAPLSRSVLMMSLVCRSFPRPGRQRSVSIRRAYGSGHRDSSGSSGAP